MTTAPPPYSNSNVQNPETQPSVDQTRCNDEASTPGVLTGEIEKKEITSTVSDEASKAATLDQFFIQTAPEFMCAFGPPNSFFIAAPYINGTQKWKYSSNGAKFLYKIPSTTISRWQVARFFYVALSPHGAGYFSYEALDGSCTWKFMGISDSARPFGRKARKEFDQLKEPYERLKTWLNTNVTSVESAKGTKVVFGPRARYLAWEPSGGYIENDLPKGLSIEIQRRKETSERMVMPLYAAFGLGDSWAAIWSKDGRGTTIELDGKYALLKKELESDPSKPILNVFLDHCSKSENFFIVCPVAQRYLFERLEPSRVAVAQEIVYNWYQSAAQSLNTTLAMSSKGNAFASKTFIGPGDAAKAEKARETKEAK